MKTMKATKTRPGKTKVAISIAPSPMIVDGLPISYHPSFSVEVGQFGPVELKKALADAEMITSLLRKHPKEMSQVVNHVMAGKMEDARKMALKIGLTEEAFQQNGGGMLFWFMIMVAGGVIFGCAAFGC
jgi:hypothetical protein